MENHFNNPMSKSIKVIFTNMRGIKIEKAADVIPTLIMIIIYIFVLIVCLVLWLYGVISVFEQVFRHLIKTMTASVKESENSNLENVPIFISIGLCCILWLPFAILVFPLIVIGYIASGFLE